MMGERKITLISLATLNALVYPAYEKINLTMAFVAPYAVASEVPSQAFRQFIWGSGTLVWPPSTTSPAIEILCHR